MSFVPRIRIASPLLRSLTLRSSVDRAILPTAAAAARRRNGAAKSSLLEQERSRQHQVSFLSTASAAAATATANRDPSSSSDVRDQQQEENSSNTSASASSADGPRGELFAFDKQIGPTLVGKAGWIRRTFGPRSNAEAMLTCGGEALAAHASFDPDYIRAKGWIRQHAVGPAVLSPVLVSGLVGALVEAAFPQSVPDTQAIKILRPLIVGVEVVARIEVTEVLFVEGGGRAGNNSSNERNDRRQHGYTVRLKTTVSRERDALALAEGSHSIWIPDYLRM